MDEEYEAKVAGVTAPKKKGREVATAWDSLPSDLLESILQKLNYEDLLRCKAVSKAFKKSIESDVFRQSRGGGREGSFTAINYSIRNKTWRWCGYDVESNSWRSLPTFSSCLPSPGRFMEFFVHGHGSLMCAHVSKGRKKVGKLVVFNPLTGRNRVLPPLLNPRSPVLVHISVDSGGKSYTVVAAGSSSESDEHLQRKVEVFCSTTSKWTEAGEIPGRAYELKDQQTGVCINGILYCIAFLKRCLGDRGVVAFDVKNGTWLENPTCLIPYSFSCSILQLVECNGKVHLFSERHHPGSVERWIDVLDSAALATGKCAWERTDVYSITWDVDCQYTCVSFGEGKLCVFNTQRCDGVVYDMRDGSEVAVLPPPPTNQKGEDFLTLNMASFTLEPSFGSDTFLMFPR